MKCMKKAISLLLTFCMAASCMAVSALAADEVVPSLAGYNLHDFPAMLSCLRL